MTGFGRASAEAGDRRLHVEIRSLNHRGLDLKIRSREADAYCDYEIGRAVRASLERGAISVQLRDESVTQALQTIERRVNELGVAEPIVARHSGADQILVLHEGRIVERGTHDGLVQHGGVYAALHRQQQLEEELAAS